MTSLDSPTVPVEAPPSRHALGNLIWSPSRAARLLRRVNVSLLFLCGLWVEATQPVASLQRPVLYGMKDFLQDYDLARAIIQHMDPYLPISALAQRVLGVTLSPPLLLPTPHPPTLGLLLLPITVLDYPAAAALWLVFETACLVISIYLLGRNVGVRLGILATLVIATIAVAWFPVSHELVLGQLTLPILLLLVAAERLLQSGRRTVGGALIGLSILLKPIAWPVLLIFVVRRSWRPLAGALPTILAGAAAAVAAIGFGGVFAYATQVLPSVARAYHAADRNISLWTVGWRVFEGMGSPVMPEMSAPPLIQSPVAASVVSAGLPVVILVAALVAIRKRSEATSFGLMLCVAVLISPISWIQDLILVLIPVVGVGAWLLRHNLPSRQTNFALLVAVMLVLGDDWTRLAFLVGEITAFNSTGLIPFAPALLNLGPAVAVGALASLLIVLPDAPAEVRDE